MSVKIVHAADFHLDSAFGALSAEQARQRVLNVLLGAARAASC